LRKGARLQRGTHAILAPVSAGTSRKTDTGDWSKLEIVGEHDRKHAEKALHHAGVARVAFSSADDGDIAASLHSWNSRETESKTASAQLHPSAERPTRPGYLLVRSKAIRRPNSARPRIQRKSDRSL